MAKAKTQAEAKPVEEKITAPEETTAEATTPAEEKAEAGKEDNKDEAKTQAEAKVYKLKSENKYLTCSGLGVQFINGYATTSSVEVARALVKISGVELVED